MVITTDDRVESVLDSLELENAIKMDGGGSSQLWYAGKTIVESSDVEKGLPPRELASGLLVYYLYSFTIQEQPQWLIIVEGEQVTIRITLQNTGSDVWQAGEYKLINILRSFGQNKEVILEKNVEPGDTITFEWTTPPIEDWGVLISSWQMSNGIQEFPGNDIRFRVVVIPKELADRKEEIEQEIKELLEEGGEFIEQKILDLIASLLQDQINTICGSTIIGIPLVTIFFSATFVSRKKNKHIK